LVLIRVSVAFVAALREPVPFKVLTYG